MTATMTVQVAGFRGEVIAPDDDGYEGARAVWNGTVDRRPALIARCSGTADVVAAVRFAREHDLEIAVRGGGHNVAGTALCDDGIVIDLSTMSAVTVDPVERVAIVQGGALWGDVDHETQAYGLATTGGIVGHTGVGGLTLGGGIGWLMRKHGLVVDNLHGELQTVIKPLGLLFQHLQGIGGSTILGNGQVALILDIPSLFRHLQNHVEASAGDLRQPRMDISGF